MARLKAIPVSKAKTAWGLLVDVKRAITEEPKRAHMGTFKATVLPENGGPACGTVGCFAGWVALLSGADPNRSIGESDAQTRLGWDLRYYIVGRRHMYVFNAGTGDACDTTRPGTRAHARAVVARINRFMQVNKKQLKARSLPGRGV